MTIYLYGATGKLGTAFCHEAAKRGLAVEAAPETVEVDSESENVALGFDTHNDIMYNWPGHFDIEWPDVTWGEFFWIDGDFYHELIEE